MAITNDFFSALNDPKAAMWSAGVAFNRSNPLPLDKWSVFQSMDEAVAYAESNAVAYPGQIIAVYDNNDMVACVLTEVEGKLVPEAIGVVPEGDGITIEVIDGQMSLVGFEAAEEGAQLVKGANGKLSWVVPSTETVEGLQTTVAALQQDIKDIRNELNPVDEEGNPVEGGLVSDVDDLKESVGEEATYDENGNQLTPATGIYKDIEDIEDKIGSEAQYDDEGSLSAAATGLYAELEKKADKESVYTKEETDSQIDSKIGAAIVDSDHLRREIVGKVEDIDPAADGAEKYIYMVPTGLQVDDDKYDEYMVINGKVEKVGSWEVDLSSYAKTETVNAALDLKADAVDLEGKVDKIEGSRLMSNAEGDKLAGIAAGAEVNVIASVDSEFNVTEDRKLELLSVGQEKVTGLSEKLNNIDEELVEVNEALTNLEDTKVSKKVSTVTNEDGSTKEVEWTLVSPEDQEKLASLVIGDNGVEISGKVNADNVEGLGSWISKSKNTVDGLMSDAQETKLEGIEAEAEKNFINGVTEDFSVNVDRVLSLNDIAMSKVTGLNEAMNVVQSKVTSLDQIVNGYTTDDGQVVKGLVARFDDYVTIANFNLLVADVEDLKENDVTIMADITAIKEILKWNEMQ